LGLILVSRAVCDGGGGEKLEAKRRVVMVERGDQLFVV